MSAFITPRHDTCASCEIPLLGWPLYRSNEAFCCVGCADGGPCLCTYESDRADDGVDGLGLPFGRPFATPVPAARPTSDEAPVAPVGVTSSPVASR
jgi:hypothetical protein